MLGILIAVILVLLGVLHGLWGARVWWPFGTEAALVAGAVGAKGMTKGPPPWAAYLVAIALVVSAFWALLLSGWLTVPLLPNWLVVLGGSVIGAVFLGRGLFGLTPAFARITPVEPFRTLDRKYYTPLCIALGGGMLVLLIW